MAIEYIDLVLKEQFEDHHGDTAVIYAPMQLLVIGMTGTTPVVGCLSCGVIVFDEALHTKHHQTPVVG